MRRRKYVRKATASRRVYRRRRVVRRKSRSYVRRAPARRRVVRKRYPARTPRAGNPSPMFSRAAIEQLMLNPRSLLDRAAQVLSVIGGKRDRAGEAVAMSLGDDFVGAAEYKSGM